MELVFYVCRPGNLIIEDLEGLIRIPLTCLRINLEKLQGVIEKTLGDESAGVCWSIRIEKRLTIVG